MKNGKSNKTTGNLRIIMQNDVDKMGGMMYDYPIINLEDINVKKIIAMLLAVMMLVTMASCGEAEAAGAKVIEIQLTEEEMAKMGYQDETGLI